MPTDDTSSARETHFQGFAKALWQAIEEELRSQAIYLDSGGSSEEWVAIMQPLLAQAASDFAQHVRQHINWYDPEISEIPDMPEWKWRNNAD